MELLVMQRMICRERKEDLGDWQIPNPTREVGGGDANEAFVGCDWSILRNWSLRKKSRDNGATARRISSEYKETKLKNASH
jgi:hypothetical protein